MELVEVDYGILNLSWINQLVDVPAVSPIFELGVILPNRKKN